MMPADKSETLASLATDILIQAQTLVGQELVAAKDELAGNWAKVQRVVVYFTLTAIVTLALVVVGSLMLSHLLATSTAIVPWLCEAIVTLGLFAVGFSLFAITRMYARKLDFYPRNTIDAFKEDMQCLKKIV